MKKRTKIAAFLGAVLIAAFAFGQSFDIQYPQGIRYVQSVNTAAEVLSNFGPGQFPGQLVVSLNNSQDTALWMWNQNDGVWENIAGDTLTLDGPLTVTGTTTHTGNVTNSGTLAVTGAQTFTGAGTFNGSVNLGSNAADTITVNSPLIKNVYRQDFEGPCLLVEAADFTPAIATDAAENFAICEGDISIFLYRLDGAQSTPFIVQGGALDIDNDGIDNEGVEIIFTDSATSSMGWTEVGTTPAMYFKASVTIESVSGTDNFYVGWRINAGFVDDLVIASVDTYGVHLINDTSGNLVIQTGDDTADGTDENDQNAVWADAETIVLEVRVATNGDFSFYVDSVQVTESSATGAASSGEVLYPVIGLLNASDADTETLINWVEIGEVQL